MGTILSDLWNNFVNFLIKLKGFYEYYFFYVAIIIGLLLWGIAYILTLTNFATNYCNGFNTVGTIIFTAGIFGGITKSGLFLDVYKKTLSNILTEKKVLTEDALIQVEAMFQKTVYGEKFVGKRSDLEQIWENLTLQVSQEKFSNIHDVILQNIKKFYLPIKHDFYYDEVKITIFIKFLDNIEYVEVTEKHSASIITDSQDPITYKFTNITPCDPKEHELTTLKLNYLKVNDNDYNVSQIKSTYNPEKTHLNVVFETALQGSKRYNLIREVTKTYKLSLNRDKRLLAVWLYHKCNIVLHYPENLKIQFFPIGVLNDWKVESKPDYNLIEADYRGLIYKNQGFMFYLEKK